MSYLHLEQPTSLTEHDRAFGWSGRLPRVVGGFLLALLATGLTVRLLRFGGFVQWSLVVHTVLGFAALVPVSLYAARHWGFYRREERASAAAKLLGSLVLLAVTLAFATGLWAAARALFGQRVAPLDRSAHLIASLAVALFGLAHLLPVWLRRPKAIPDVPRFLAARRGYVSAVVALAAVLVLIAVPGSILHSGASTSATFPAGYVPSKDLARPFAPALAASESGRALAQGSLSHSAACGSPRCHPSIYAEWSVSGHRWSGTDIVFRRVAEQVAATSGPESTRYCAGCHEPVAVLSATTPSAGSAAREEGISCVTCHSIASGAPGAAKGYVVRAPARYLFEGSSGAGSVIAGYLIRAYPDQHRRSFGKPDMAQPELCGSCHRQVQDGQTQKLGLVRIQNQYEQWRQSKWNRPGDKNGSVECRECHMPLLEGVDASVGAPGRGWRNLEGKHRSHRFLGANGYMPTLLGIDGAQTQAGMTEQWLHGEYPIPEIAERWDKGPIVALSLQAPETAVVGQPIELQALVASRKVGHSYPTGPLDLTQAWIEIEARDAAGKLVFSSGELDDKQVLLPGAVVFRADSGGSKPGAPAVALAAMRDTPSVPAGGSESESYGFSCPSVPGRPTAVTKAHVALSQAGFLSVSARLRYRKLDPLLLETLFPGKGITAPIVDLARASARIAVYARK